MGLDRTDGDAERGGRLLLGLVAEVTEEHGLSLPAGEPFVYRMVELDAKIRLAGLQAWLRRGPQDADVLTRLAKAGQAYYDPFTGLPMLVNQRKGVIYSVGRDGKDQEGDGLRDVTAMIPAFSSSDARRPQASLH